jgi:hypothetical protein
MSVEEGRMQGNALRFHVAGADYAAVLKADSLEGTRRAEGVASRWRAVRRRP